MKPIESVNPRNEAGLTRRIADFWTRNVNAERLYGQSVSAAERGSEEYFRDLEDQRYRSHTHLPPWIARVPPGARTLEIGCGVGLDAFRMATAGVDLTAVDLTRVGVATAAMRFRRAGLGTAFAACDAMQLPFADGSFDCEYSFGVLHHAADTAACIDEVRRVLRPGGTALIMLYHRRSLNELVHRLMRVPFEEKDELCPVVRRYTRAEVEHIFRAWQGLRIDVEYLFGEGYGAVYRWFPRPAYRWLSRRFGWHLMITATR